jgi:hypothetical protein
MGIVDPHRSCGEEYTSISVALFGSIGHFIRFKVGNLHDGNLFTHTHKSDLSLEEPCSLAPKVQEWCQMGGEERLRRMVEQSPPEASISSNRPRTIRTPGPSSRRVRSSHAPFIKTRHVLTCATQYPPRGLLGHSTIFTYCEPSSYNTPWLSFSTEKGGYLTSSF